LDNGHPVLALAVIGFVPASVPHSYVSVPFSFLAAMQIGLFRNIGDLVYLPVATTGNSHAIRRSGIRRIRREEAGFPGRPSGCTAL
jgi:uncharacterized membrane protein YoaK (UPF0700 family)